MTLMFRNFGTGVCALRRSKWKICSREWARNARHAFALPLVLCAPRFFRSYIETSNISFAMFFSFFSLSLLRHFFLRSFVDSFASAFQGNLELKRFVETENCKYVRALHVKTIIFEYMEVRCENTAVSASTGSVQAKGKHELSLVCVVCVSTRHADDTSARTYTWTYLFNQFTSQQTTTTTTACAPFLCCKIVYIFARTLRMPHFRASSTVWTHTQDATSDVLKMIFFKFSRFVFCFIFQQRKCKTRRRKVFSSFFISSAYRTKICIFILSFTHTRTHTVNYMHVDGIDATWVWTREYGDEDTWLWYEDVGIFWCVLSLNVCVYARRCDTDEKHPAKRISIIKKRRRQLNEDTEQQ